MSYKIDIRGKIGFKELSQADLGTGSSHQTHIGLYSNVLEHLGNSEIVPSSILIIGSRYYFLDCYFDRIQNPDGTFRSPKIRSGRTESIVRKIREFANRNKSPLYLLWFSLTDGRIVFYLLTCNDEELNYIFNELGEFGAHEISYGMRRFLSDQIRNVLPQL